MLVVIAHDPMVAFRASSDGPQPASSGSVGSVVDQSTASRRSTTSATEPARRWSWSA